MRTVGDGEGTRPNQFCHPYDVAVDPSGRVYVADNSNHRIVRYGPAPSYKYRARWGAFGSRPRAAAVPARARRRRRRAARSSPTRAATGSTSSTSAATSLGSFGKSGPRGRPVHPPAGRRRRRGRHARGRGLGQRPDPAAEPRRQRRRDVRRAGARADAAARPGRASPSTAPGLLYVRRPGALARARLRPRGARSSARSARAAAGRASCSRRPRWPSPPAGRVYVADTGNGRIVRFTTAGTHLGSFGRFRDAPRRRGLARRLARLRRRTLRRNRITVMTATGGDLAEFGAAAPSPASCARPAGSRSTAPATSGSPTAATTASQAFTPDGALVHRFGERGVGAGPVHRADGVSVACNGLVTVGRRRQQPRPAVPVRAAPAPARRCRRSRTRRTRSSTPSPAAAARAHRDDRRAPRASSRSASSRCG